MGNVTQYQQDTRLKKGIRGVAKRYYNEASKLICTNKDTGMSIKPSGTIFCAGLRCNRHKWSGDEYKVKFSVKLKDLPCCENLSALQVFFKKYYGMLVFFVSMLVKLFRDLWECLHECLPDCPIPPISGGDAKYCISWRRTGKRLAAAAQYHRQVSALLYATNRSLIQHMTACITREFVVFLWYHSVNIASGWKRYENTRFFPMLHFPCG